MAFILNRQADIDGTHKVGELILSPLALVRAFGAPVDESGDGKTNGEFYFTRLSDGAVFSVYAYKRAVDWTDFRGVTFSVGAHGEDPTALALWLREKLSSALGLDI